MSDTRRIFIAIPLAGQVMTQTMDTYRNQAADAVARCGFPAGAWGPELAGNHLTLRFVGDVESGEPMQEMYNVVEREVKQHPPLVLVMGERGAFPDAQDPNVLWVGVNGNLGLLRDLQASVSGAVSRMGYHMQEPTHDFVPHVTVGRLKVEDQLARADMLERWMEQPEPSGREMPYLVRSAGMYTSHRGGDGRIQYSRVGLPFNLDPTLLR